MLARTSTIPIRHDAPIPTWLGVGGHADRFALVDSIHALEHALALDPNLLVLGEGANLLVDDDGVDRLVVQFTGPAMRRIEIDPSSGRVVAAAGASLARLVTLTARAGLAGLTGLVGIPASVGGAVRMNAGGAFGCIAQYLERVVALDRLARRVERSRDDIDFDYRHAELDGLIIVEASFCLPRAQPERLRQHLRSVMDFKRRSQPLREHSAGCAFRNPVLTAPLDGLGQPGHRVSAGALIERAGCKGMRVGGAEVSARHANFILTRPGARARDVLALMNQVAARVHERFGLRLEPEIVIWKRDST